MMPEAEYVQMTYGFSGPRPGKSEAREKDTSEHDVSVPLSSQ